MEDLIKEILEETKAVKGEKELLSDLKKAKLSDEDAAILQATVRLFSGVSENLKKSGVVIKQLQPEPEPATVDAKSVAAFLKESKPEVRAEISKELKLDEKRFEEAFGFLQEPTSELLKSDGSLNLDAIPKELQPAMKLIFKDSQDTKAALKEAQEKIAKADQDAKRKVMVAKAEEFKDVPGTDVNELADTLMKLDDADQEKILKPLRATKEAMKESGLFTEFGKGGPGNPAGTAIEKVNQLIKNLIQKNDKLTEADALTQVMRENPVLYGEYVKETVIRA